MPGSCEITDRGPTRIARAAALVSIVLAAPALAQDWSGSYVGVGVGSNLSGEFQFFAGGFPEASLSGPINPDFQLMLFAGHAWQRGALVLGGELAYARGEADVEVAAPASIVLGDSVDLKGRVGYAKGPMLIYGVIGHSWGSVVGSTTNGPFEADLSGLNYGIGVDYRIGRRLLLGIEYLERDLQGDFTLGMVASPSATPEAGTLSLRLGTTF